MSNKPVIERWIAALESGEYPQTRGHLRVVDEPQSDDDSPVGFCCLGVLCELAALIREQLL